VAKTIITLTHYILPAAGCNSKGAIVHNTLANSVTQ